MVLPTVNAHEVIVGVSGASVSFPSINAPNGSGVYVGQGIYTGGGQVPSAPTDSMGNKYILLASYTDPGGSRAIYVWYTDNTVANPFKGSTSLVVTCTSSPAFSGGNLFLVNLTNVALQSIDGFSHQLTSASGNFTIDFTSAKNDELLLLFAECIGTSGITVASPATAIDSSISGPSGISASQTAATAGVQALTYNSTGADGAAILVGVIGAPPPLSVTAIRTPSSGIAPLAVSFTATASGGISPYTAWSWNFGDGGTSTEQNPTYTYTSPGTFSATVTVTDSASSQATSSPVTTTVISTPSTGTGIAGISSDHARLGNS